MAGVQFQIVLDRSAALWLLHASHYGQLLIEVSGGFQICCSYCGLPERIPSYECLSVLRQSASIHGDVYHSRLVLLLA